MTPDIAAIVGCVIEYGCRSVAHWCHRPNELFFGFNHRNCLYHFRFGRNTLAGDDGQVLYGPLPELTCVSVAKVIQRQILKTLKS